MCDTCQLWQVWAKHWGLWELQMLSPWPLDNAVMLMLSKAWELKGLERCFLKDEFYLEEF